MTTLFRAKVCEALGHLASLVGSGQWAEVGKTLSPEVHHLVINWHDLSPKRRGELAGYTSFGKHGAEIAPGSMTKLAKKGGKVVKELAPSI